jgi:hypothetical protein
MQPIEFHDTTGRHIKLIQPSGAEGWQIMIDNFYNGILFKRNGEWVAYLAPGSDLTADDVQVLGERIDENI